MSRLARVTALLALLLCSLPLALAQDPKPTEHPFLWRIEGEPEHYLYGTMHLADPRITTIPEIVEDALYSSGALYTELAFDQAMAGVSTRMFLPDDQTLKDILPEDVYAEAEAFLEDRGMRIDPFRRMTVWGFYMTLSTLDFGEMMRGGEPLDMYLYNEARAMGLDVGGLETVDEQISVFADLPIEDQIHLVDVTLDDLRESAPGEQAEEMVDAYLRGDAAALDLLVGESLGGDPIQAALMERLLPDRNHRMAERIDAHIKARPDTRFFFAVGAAHMPGPEGVVALLEKRGYSVSRLAAPPDETPTLANVMVELRALRAEVEALRDRVEQLEAVGAASSKRYSWR